MLSVYLTNEYCAVYYLGHSGWALFGDRISHTSACVYAQLGISCFKTVPFDNAFCKKTLWITLIILLWKILQKLQLVQHAVARVVIGRYANCNISATGVTLIAIYLPGNYNLKSFLSPLKPYMNGVWSALLWSSGEI